MKSGFLLAAATALLIGATSYAQEVVKDTEKAAKSTAKKTAQGTEKAADATASGAKNAFLEPSQFLHTLRRAALEAIPSVKSTSVFFRDPQR